VSWYQRQNRAEQKWVWGYLIQVSRRRVIQRRFSVRSFRIVSVKKSGKFALYMEQRHQTQYGFRAKTSQVVKDWRSHFYYDARTKTLRNVQKKSYVLGGQKDRG